MKLIQGNIRDRSNMPRSISLVLAASVLTLLLPHYSLLPIFYIDELRFDMFYELVWYISTNNGVYSISLRETLSYLRWLPLVILAGAALRLAIYKRAVPRPLNKADGYIVTFLVLILISCLYSIDSRISLLRVASVILMYTAIFWGVWVIADEFGEKTVVSVIVNAAAVVFGLHALVAVFDPVHSFPYYGRFEGWMVNPGTAAGYAALLLPLALWRASQRSRWQYWLLVGAILFVLIMSQTRTEIIAAVIGSMYFLLRTFPKRRFISLLSTILVLAVSYIWLQIGPRLFPQGTEFSWNKIDYIVLEGNISSDTVLETSTDRVVPGVSTDATVLETSTDRVVSGVSTDDTVLETGTDRVVSEPSTTTDLNNGVDVEVLYRQENPRSQHATTLSSRTDKWRVGLEYFLERPLQGFGFGTEDQLFDYHDVEDNAYIRTGSYFHNSFLGLSLQVGLIGALLFYVPLGILLYREMCVSFIDQHDSLRTSLLAVALTCMVAAIASSDLYSMGNTKALPFWISIMLLVRYRYASNIGKKDVFSEL